jgi:hypothetical protein
MTDELRFGLRLPQEITDFSELRDLAQAAEELGYHSVWLYDHFFHFPTPENLTVLEPWTLMSVIAGATSRIRVGTMVLCNAYRPPSRTKPNTPFWNSSARSSSGRWRRHGGAAATIPPRGDSAGGASEMWGCQSEPRP